MSSPSSNPTVETCLLYCNKTDTVSNFCPTPCLSICPSTCRFSLTPNNPNPPSQPITTHSHTLSPLLLSIIILVLVLSLLILITISVICYKARIRRRSVKVGPTVIDHQEKTFEDSSLPGGVVIEDGKDIING